jgi:hypothetical protein
MGLRVLGATVLVAAAGLWLASGTLKEKPVLSHAKAEAVRPLESDFDANDPLKVQKLAQAYLGSHAPGHAVAIVESAPAHVRADARVDHVYARALVEQGRNQDALTAERRVLAKCAPIAQGTKVEGCDSFILASATRRAEVLQALVNLGVEDSQAEPEASALAYHAVTREARVAMTH